MLGFLHALEISAAFVVAADLGRQHFLLMADLTWIQVVDDAVKIGFGATIAGAFGLIVAKHGSRSAIQKMQFERRTAMLTDITQSHEEYFQLFLNYSSHLRAIASFEENPRALQSPKFQEVKKKVDAMQIQLADKIPVLFGAQAKLALLGEKKCEQAANAAVVGIQEALGWINKGGSKCDAAKWTEMANAVTEARNAFYQELHAAFDRAPKIGRS